MFYIILLRFRPLLLVHILSLYYHREGRNNDKMKPRGNGIRLTPAVIDTHVVLLANHVTLYA